MAFLIGEPCVDVMDRSCITVCPADCIYVGKRKLYINPVECVDCGACEPQCPVQAIYIDDDVPPGDEWLIADNADFFTTVLPGRDKPVGNPGGAGDIGPLGADTPRIAVLPVKDRT
ncbi:ferredoxin [Mycobacterium sp.]|uniref:ferredoxin n=1 Tax=Mycobacterium sp. TaxID=1785 RepID=UPI002C9AF006|nr:ferredoxin [Mycobacterium sp.]HME49550.1 ferredoxin [Mycobacterium sp.]